MDLGEKTNTTNVWELRHDIFGSNDSLSKAVESKACVLQCVEGRGRPLIRLTRLSKYIILIMIWQTVKLHSQPTEQTGKLWDKCMDD